jgi:K+-sensing histidine kinase KdpD
VSALTKLPGWLYLTAALLVSAVVGGVYLHAHGASQGRAALQVLWDTDKATRAAVETKAVARRAAENLAQAKQQATTALAITKAYDEELYDVRARLASAERMRKPAFCASAGPAAPDTAESPASSNAANPANGLLPDAVAQDIQAVILHTEEVAAAGRACQRFVRENGMAP